MLVADAARITVLDRSKLPGGSRDSATARALAEAFPRLAELAVAEADAAAQGMLVLPGTGSKRHFVGDPPDWMANPNPGSAGDLEFVWQLNRLEHWKSLLRGSLISGEERYRDRAIAELRDWLHRCHRPPLDLNRCDELFNESNQVKRLRGFARRLESFPLAFRAAQRVREAVRESAKALRRAPGTLQSRRNGHASAALTAKSNGTAHTQKQLERCAVAPWRSLEAGVRMYEIWPLLFLPLKASPLADVDLVQRFVTSAHEHGEVLANVSPRLYPNADHNHYLCECLGLLATACHFSHFRESGDWAQQAIREIERCAAVQLTADGGHVEGCPHYHNCCVYFFCEAALLAREHDLSFSPQFQLQLRKSLKHCVHALRPTGQGVPWGDSDADTLAVKATLFGYLALGEIAPLRHVATLTGIDAVAERCFEHLWQVPDAAELLRDLQRSDGSRETSPLPRYSGGGQGWGPPSHDDAPAWPRVSQQRQLKQVMLRSGWDRDALSVYFACRTPVFNGHAHADPCGFDFTGLGQPLLVDPGRFTYADTPQRREIKSAAFHNCLTIDGRDPFEYLSSWRFSPQQQGEIVAVHEHDNLLAAEAVHHNYRPAVHRRLVAIVDDQFLLVLDRVEGLRRRSRVQMWFHVNAATAELDASRHLAAARVGDVHLELHASSGLRMITMPGRVSEMFDQSHASTRVRLDDLGPGSSERAYATLVVPSRDAATPGEIIAPTIELTGGCAIVRLTVAGLPHQFLWTPGQFSDL